MLRFAKITRMVSNILAEVKGLGGTTQNRMISLKGLYSKPRGDNAIVIPLSKGNNQDVILVLQKEVELEDGDIYLTDDKSYIHFHFNGESIELKTKKLEFNVDKFVVNANTVDFNGCTIKNNGTSIDDTHTHTQNSGNHFGGGATTSPPR